MKVHTIVVGYDGSEQARAALHAAADLVAADGIVHVVTAHHPISHSSEADMRHSIPEEFRYVYYPAGEQENLLADAALMLDERGVTHETHLVADDPATAILEMAEKYGAGLIVVGSRGAGAVRRFMRGSVSSRVATHADGSVLVVQEPFTA